MEDGGRRGDQRRAVMKKEGQRCSIAGLEDAGKGQEVGFPLEFLEEHSPVTP